MYPSFLLQAFFFTWLFTEGVSRKITRREISNPVFVEIKPGIFQSKNVIKIEPLEKRPKRDKAGENPSLVLEFNPGFFSNPKLKDLYDALTGAHEYNQHISLTRSKLAPPEESKILQINPLKEKGINFKRELKAKSQKDTGGFSLKINPETPPRNNPVRTYNKTCLDKQPEEEWCATAHNFDKCPATEPTIPTITTCHPTLPPSTTKKLHFCGPNFRDHRTSLLPCALTTCSKPRPTEYVACQSSPPPSVMPEWGCATKVSCQDRITTCPTTPQHTTTVPITQKCDNFQQCVNLQSEPDRYFILFKRSPLDSWSTAFRKKREKPLGIFKFKLVPMAN